MSSRLSDYDYALPEERIAKYPPPQREDSRLLVLHRATGEMESRRFPDFLEYLRPGDALVFNDTRVFRARLLGQRESGGKIETFLLEEREQGLWRCMTYSGRPLKPGAALVFGEDPKRPLLRGRVREVEADGCRLVAFEAPGGGTVREAVSRLGRMPIPPYLKRADEPIDAERYQTVYARHEGAVAAPTAGLHFTHAFLEKAAHKGIRLLWLTLHVGRGTFAPVLEDDLSLHKMEREFYRIPPATLAGLRETRESGGRIIAVGTTSVRALESYGATGAPEGGTEIFIRPPFAFQWTDALLTNFHLPKSTLMMLVSAFAQPGGEGGRELILRAYQKALAEEYRFFSYGDAMLVL